MGIKGLLPRKPKIPAAAFNRLKDLHSLKPCRVRGLKTANADSQKIPERTSWKVMQKRTVTCASGVKKVTDDTVSISGNNSNRMCYGYDGDAWSPQKRARGCRWSKHQPPIPLRTTDRSCEMSYNYGKPHKTKVNMNTLSTITCAPPNGQTSIGLLNARSIKYKAPSDHGLFHRRDL